MVRTEKTIFIDNDTFFSTVIHNSVATFETVIRIKSAKPNAEKPVPDSGEEAVATVKLRRTRTIRGAITNMRTYAPDLTFLPFFFSKDEKATKVLKGELAYLQNKKTSFSTLFAK